MRIYPVLFFKGRKPQNPNKVPLSGVVPLKLKDNIQSSKESGSTGICLQELTLLLACLKASNFNEGNCHKELGAFKECFQRHKVTESEGGQEIISKNVETKRNIRKLLKRYT